MEGKQQKQLVYVAGAAILAWLLYSYIRGRQTAGGTSTPVDTASSDYAALAGQEQGDMAAMQAQNQQLLGQELSDVAGLTAQEQSDVAAQQAQELQDFSGVTATLGGVTNAVQGFGAQVGSLGTQVAGANTQIARLATGQQQANRTITGLGKVIQAGLPKGSMLAPYGHKPAEKAGFAIKGLGSGFWAYVPKAKPKTHPSAPKNKSVAHPNPAHKQQSTAHQPSKPAKPAPKKPAPKTVAKRSGTRR